ncbi:MAG: glycosyltransferase [Bacteroides sp.]|nr:glycosyltransferase [Bacteroides sp.]
MTFSVLLSIYKKEHPTHLKQSLDSLFAQTLLPTEVVLVKDGPLTPELDSVIAEYVQKYPVIKLVPLAQNGGLGKALNEGLKHCSFDLIARMDTDDIAKPMRFEKQVEVFRLHPEVDICSAWIDEFEEDTSHILSCRKLPEHHKEIAKYAKSRCPLNHPVVMFRKKAVTDAGGYLHFPLLEDYFLWVRMLMNGCKFYNIQESLLYFRTSPDMFKRRGGWIYAMNEIRFQLMLHRMHFTSLALCLKNISVRFVVRLIPNGIRKFIYQRMLRK